MSKNLEKIKKYFKEAIFDLCRCNITNKDIKLYLYSNLYFLLLYRHINLNLINSFIYYRLYIINNKYIIYSPLSFIFEVAEYRNCFKKIKSKYVKKVDRSEIENYIIKNFLRKEVGKFFEDFAKGGFKKLEKKIKFKYSIGKDIILDFDLENRFPLKNYINSFKEYLKFLNILFSYIFKNLNIELYELFANVKININDLIWEKFLQNRYYGWESKFSSYRIIYSPKNNDIYRFLDYKKEFKSIILKLNCFIQNKKNMSIFKEYKNDLSEIVSLINKMTISKIQVLFLRVIFKVWYDLDFWSKYLGCRKRKVKQREFKEKYYFIEVCEEINSCNEIHITFHIQIPFFKEAKIEQKLLDKRESKKYSILTETFESILDKRKLILKVCIDDLSGIGVNMNSNKDTLILYNKENDKKVYEIKLVNTKIINIIE